jgi:hypothetical protein
VAGGILVAENIPACGVAAGIPVGVTVGAEIDEFKRLVFCGAPAIKSPAEPDTVLISRGGVAADGGTGVIVAVASKGVAAFTNP